MNLRPHHILCIQKFTGHGYSEAFTAHMTSVVSGLTDQPQTQITLTEGGDGLCKMCPNSRNGACISLDKVAMMDAAVLRICDLAYMDNVVWEEVARKARERIFQTEEFHKICAHCQWVELCRNTEICYE